MGQTPILTFGKDRYFYLNDPITAAGPLDDGWESVDAQTYRTSSLKAAERFRPHADETAERVFTRAFNRDVEVPPLRPLSFLDPHQVEGVNWILTRTRSYLAHAPGAGKTAQAIIAGSLIKGNGRIVLIVPPGLTLNWEREIWKFTEKIGIAFPTIGIVGSTATRKGVAWRSDYIIVPDSMLAKPWVYERLQAMEVKLLAVDEASRFKDPLSVRSKALFGGRTIYRSYAGLFQNAKHTVMLDGSPMPNRPMELWAPVYALDPEAIDCMAQTDFGFRYCGARMNDRGQWEFKHSSNERELKDRLQKRFMHVVSEDRLEHPERRRSILLMNQDVRSPEMKAWERRNLKLLSSESVSEALSQGEIATHRKELGLRKVPWVSRYILSRLENNNERILVFAWHREVCIKLADLIGGRGHAQRRVALVIGGTPAEERERIFTNFQKGDGALRVIVGNIAAMGRGFNLQRADRVVFCESSWSPESNLQCEKRAARRGRDVTLPVRCEYVVAPDSLDERIMRALFAKERSVKRVIG